MPECIEIHIEQGVATVTLARPEVHNAFNEVMIAELDTAFTELGKRAGVRAIVLAGAGRSFCAGADLHWMKRMIDFSRAENVADAEAVARMLHRIRHSPRPVIARVHGAALGGGVGLVAACDIAIARRDAIFGLSEVRLGIIPAVISPYVLERMGAGPARRYFLTAERFNAARAQELNLVSELVDTDEALDAAVQSVIQAVMQNGPEAVAAAKALIADVLAFDWSRAAALTAERIADRRTSSEGQEGMRAFLEKRPPAWTVN